MPECLIADQFVRGTPYSKWGFECTCQYCGKKWKNIQALRCHYRECSNRLLMRYYVCDPYLFGLYCNPGKYLLSIEEEIKLSGDPKLVVGAIRVNVFTKKIFNFMVMQFKRDKVFPNGRVFLNDIRKTLYPDERVQFEKELSSLLPPPNPIIRVEQE